MHLLTSSTIFVLCMLCCDKGADTNQTPTVSATEGDTVRLACRTRVRSLVDWKKQLDPRAPGTYIVSRGGLLDKYKPRFEFDNDTYALIIHNATDNDSGLYYCCEDMGAGLQHFVQLNVEIVECRSNPCLNEGTCIDGVSQYTCSCQAGYSGVNCQTDVDECASSPCENNGTCIDGVNRFTCDCVDGFTGTDCQTRLTRGYSVVEIVVSAIPVSGFILVVGAIIGCLIYRIQRRPKAKCPENDGLPEPAPIQGGHIVVLMPSDNDLAGEEQATNRPTNAYTVTPETIWPPGEEQATYRTSSMTGDSIRAASLVTADDHLTQKLSEASEIGDQEQLRLANDGKSKLSGGYREVQQELEEIRKTLIDENTQKEELQRQVENMKEHMKKLEDDQEQLKLANDGESKIRQQLTELSGGYHGIQQELEEIRKTLSDEITQKEDLQRQAEDMKEHMKKLEDKYMSMEQENEKKMNEMNELQDKLRNVTNELHELLLLFLTMLTMNVLREHASDNIKESLMPILRQHDSEIISAVSIHKNQKTVFKETVNQFKEVGDAKKLLIDYIKEIDTDKTIPYHGNRRDADLHTRAYKDATDIISVLYYLDEYQLLKELPIFVVDDTDKVPTLKLENDKWPANVTLSDWYFKPKSGPAANETRSETSVQPVSQHTQQRMQKGEHKQDSGSHVTNDLQRTVPVPVELSHANPIIVHAEVHACDVVSNVKDSEIVVDECIRLNLSPIPTGLNQQDSNQGTVDMVPAYDPNSTLSSMEDVQDTTVTVIELSTAQ